MSRSGSVTLRFADGEHAFRLPIGRLRELQEKVDAGPMELLRRLQTGAWRIDDVREPIRLGLIGGGLAPTEASRLVERYVDDRPWVETVPVAFAIIASAVNGAPDEDAPGEAAGEAKAATRSPVESSGSPASTDRPPL